MEQSLFWESDSRSAIQEFFLPFMQPEGSLQNLQKIPIPSQINPIHTFIPNFEDVFLYHYFSAWIS
jgi:hypothetical protein